VGLREMTGERSAWDALGHLFGASSASIKTLLAIRSAASDPHAALLLRDAQDMQLRSQGANVLAERPFG
jgi:hypothetical protein